MSNLLVIMDDEHSPKALGAAGHPLMRTPNLDRLAAQGARFRRADTPSPLCVPARACLSTGLPVHRNECWDNAIAYDGTIPGWTHRLQGAGRRTCAVGKLHFTGESAPTGFDEQHVPMHLYAGGDLHGSLRDPLPVRYQSKSLVDRIGAGENEYHEYDRKIAALARKWLEERRGSGAPWALFVSFICPHYPLVAPRQFYDLYPLERIPLPKRRIEPAQPKSAWWEAFESSYIFEKYFESDTQRRSAIAAYYGMVSFIDELTGSILATLEDTGSAADTTVLFFSDHGDNLGARGLWGKSTMYEESAGVPLLLRGPGVPAGRVVSTPVSLLDVYPTALASAGILPGPEDAGRERESLVDLARREDDMARTVMSEYHGAGALSGAFMLRKGRHKYIHYVGHGAELYDLENDPEELYDLAGTPAAASLLRELEKELRTRVDPEAIDARAKAAQAALIARHGGREAVLKMGGVNATPVPGKKGVFVST